MNINLAIVERAKAGQALTAAELDELASADVLSLGMLADEVRRARVGGLNWCMRRNRRRVESAADTQVGSRLHPRLPVMISMKAKSAMAR